MKFRNFTGQMPNFVGGFSGGSPTDSLSVLWQLSTYKYRGKLATGTETAPSGVWFKPDGTKMFLTGITRNRIRSYDLTTPWDINSATNLVDMATTLLTGAGAALTQIYGVAFSDDGTKCFAVDGVTNALYRYSLSSAWDISTLNATADQTNTAIYVGALTPGSIWLSTDGLTFATVNSGTTNGWKVHTSTIANDITTLTQVSNVTASAVPVGGVFVDNGNRWVDTRQTTDLIEVSVKLTTPYRLTGWNIDNTLTVTSYDTTPGDCYMKNDGSAFYYVGSAGDGVYYFSLN